MTSLILSFNDVNVSSITDLTDCFYFWTLDPLLWSGNQPLNSLGKSRNYIHMSYRICYPRCMSRIKKYLHPLYSFPFPPHHQSFIQSVSFISYHLTSLCQWKHWNYHYCIHYNIQNWNSYIQSWLKKLSAHTCIQIVDISLTLYNELE